MSSSNSLILVLLAVTLVVFYRKKIVADWQLFRLNRQIWARDKWENWIKPLFVAAILAIAIRSFLLGPYKIPTGSMRTVLMEGDRIFVDKISYRFHEPQRGDIVVFKYPMDRKKDFVKRLIAFGGETIEIRSGEVFINGQKLETPPVLAEHFYYNREDWDYGKAGQKILIPKDHYFVLGDNSAQSSDSRNWGFVSKKDMIGRAVLIWWPPQRFRLIKDS